MTAYICCFIERRSLYCQPMDLKKLRADAVAIFEAGLSAVDPENAVRAHLSQRDGALVADGRSYPLSGYGNVYVIGMGKAAAPMARAVIGGLITSTLLTLIVVPVVYTYLDDLGARMVRWWTRKVPEYARETEKVPEATD